MCCNSDTKKLRATLEKQNEQINELMKANQQMKSQLSKLLQQEKLIAKTQNSQERKIIDLTAFSQEIDEKFKYFEDSLLQIETMSKQKKEELKVKFDELEQWKNILFDLDCYVDGQDVALQTQQKSNRKSLLCIQSIQIDLYQQILKGTREFYKIL